MASVVHRGGKFHVKFYYQGSQYWRSLKTTDPEDAKHARAAVERTIHLLETGALRVSAGVDPVTFIVSGGRLDRSRSHQHERVTCTRLEDLYLTAARARRAPNTFRTEQIHLRHFLDFLGARASRRAESITTAAIEGFVAERRGTVSATTVNKELQTVSQMFKFGLSIGACADNPVSRVQRLKEGGKSHRFLTKKEIDEAVERGGLNEDDLKELRRFRYLTPAEIQRLLGLAEGRYLLPFLAVLAYTGMRRGEALVLEWSDIDFEAKVVSVNSRKQSRTRAYSPREIEMHERLAEVLKGVRAKRAKGRYVFSDEDLEPLFPHKVWGDFRKLVKGTDFEGIGFHALRHSFSSNLARAGVDDRIIDHFMGHQTEEMRRRYQHLFPEEKRKALSRLGY